METRSLGTKSLVQILVHLGDPGVFLDHHDRTTRLHAYVHLSLSLALSLSRLGPVRACYVAHGGVATKARLSYINTYLTLPILVLFVQL